ncbi:MAG: hypothetical protein IKP03_05565 [Fibrobacter sp.]|nr:hypothetical protein [Fibrobacter sp.]
MSDFAYLYVLVSKPGDTYYEQTLVSAVSLRYHMPDANIVLLTDDRTADTLVGNRAEIKKYVTSIKCVNLPNSLSNMQRSRWLKTTIPEHITTDFLYIDSDTVIVDSLEEIESMEISLGAVLDKHSLLSNHCNRAMIEERSKKMGFCATVDDKHFNGGLLLVRRNEKNVEFFRMWHSLWLECVKKGLSIDQASLAQVNYKMNGIIQELPGIWNCQVEYGISCIDRAKILHMFVTGDKFSRRPHVLMDPEFFHKLEKDGISEETMNLIKNPWQGFKDKTQIIGGVAVDYFNSYLSRLCSLLFCYSSKTKVIFSVLDKMAKMVILKLGKRIS